MNKAGALMLSSLKDMLQQSLAATVPVNWACYRMHVQNNDKTVQ
jgi:hypothetical protein